MTKKLMMTLALCLTTILLLTGCGKSTEDKLRKKTDECFKKIQAFDIEYISSLTGESLETDETGDVNDLLSEYFKESAAKVTYEITAVDEETLTVDVTSTYVDSEQFLQEFVSNAFSVALSHLDGSETTDEEFKQIVEDSMAAVTEDQFKTKDFQIVYEEVDKDYVIISGNDELLDVATAGIYGYINELGSLLGD